MEGLTGRRARMTPGLAVLLLAAAALAPAPSAPAQQPGSPGAEEARGEPSPPHALASNGAIVAMPEISALDCRGMAEVLALLDRSGYRGPEPVGEHHPDRRIFEYENRLAAARYHACIMGENRLTDPGPAFDSGFDLGFGRGPGQP